MKVNGTHYRSIWLDDDGRSVCIIDQTRLPFELVHRILREPGDAVEAIATMRVRGAPLIGATAAYGMALAMRHDASAGTIDHWYDRLLATRPTAVNLRWALDAMRELLEGTPPPERAAAAYGRAAALCDEDVELCRSIGRHGLELLRQTWKRRAGEAHPLNILTHCNAGWLATVDWGTALAPIYAAHDAGIPVHVWVDETRPRNQGARLTAWELGQHDVPHTVIVDNAGGHLMQHGRVDLCIVGTDRVTRRGDVCNKIGTYLKALAARDTGVPFYVALPYSTIDWTIEDGLRDIAIEQRHAGEVQRIADHRAEVQITSPGSPAANYGFDVTPAAYVTAFITERGVCPASAAGLRGLYPEAPHDAGDGR